MVMCGSRIFRQGGPGHSDKKESSENVLFQSSAYFTEVNWSISKKSIIFQSSRGGSIFSRGWGPFFLGGWGMSNCLFPIDTHITCDFSPPVPLLDPHLMVEYFSISPDTHAILL